MTPVCPPGYHCRFDPVKHSHFYAHWWNGPWGIVVAILAVAGIVAIFCTIAVQWRQVRETKLHQALDRDTRMSQLAIEEQRTMQLDAAKGNPEMLKIVREMQR